MKKNLQTLNQIIKCNDNNDSSLKQKIRDKEGNIEKLDVNKNNENSSQRKENSDNEINDSNKKTVIKIKKEENLNFLNEINNSPNINKNEIITETIIQSQEKTISKENTKNNENSELFQIQNDISYISSINNQSNVTNKTSEKTIITKKGKYKLIDNQQSKNTKEKNYIKKINNNNEKRKHLNKSQTKNSKNNYKIKSKEYFNFHTQNTTFRINCDRRLNKSMEKRLRKRNETNMDKSHDKSHNKILDKSKDKNLEKFNLMYKKFEENEKKKIEKIEDMKKKQEEQNKLIYIYKPKINLKSKEIFSKKKENNKNFYERQKMLMEKYKKNDEILKERIKEEKEKEKENKVKNVNKDKYRYVKSKLFEWRDREKAMNKSNINDSAEKSDNASENSNTIYKIKVNRNIKRIINRLYENDIEKRKQNLAILNSVYTPSFQPMLLEHWKNTGISRSISKDINLKNKYRSSHRIKTNASLEIFDNKEKEDENSNMGNSINVTDLLRHRLFNKIKKKERHRSEIKLSNVIKDKNIYDTTDENNSCKYNKIRLYKNPNLTRSVITHKEYKI